jgi:hypothetical protein
MLVANLLESTEVRNCAITEIQFGVYFKDPSDFFKKVLVPGAAKLMEKPFFATFCKDVENLSTANFKDLFDSFLRTTFDATELMGIIGGTTRPKDRIWYLFADFRRELQSEWENLIYCEYPGGAPSSSSQPAIEEYISAILKAPRRVLGKKWRRMLYNVADRAALSPCFVSYKARRSSSPQLPEHVTVVEAVSKLSKNRQLGIMVNLKFEEAALAYLLNTKGALWLRAQEHQRKEFREKKVEASKVRT